jgi:hypothetical protein
MLFDETYPRGIAEDLRLRDRDAVSMHDASGAGTADEAVFDHARSKRQAVVTENIRDYRPLAEPILEAGGTHSGLILTTAKTLAGQRPGSDHHRSRHTPRDHSRRERIDGEPERFTSRGSNADASMHGARFGAVRV